MNTCDFLPCLSKKKILLIAVYCKLDPEAFFENWSQYKTSCIINEAVAQHFKSTLVMLRKETTHPVVTVSSNDFFFSLLLILVLLLLVLPTIFDCICCFPV